MIPEICCSQVMRRGSLGAHPMPANADRKGREAVNYHKFGHSARVPNVKNIEKEGKKAYIQ